MDLMARNQYLKTVVEKQNYGRLAKKEKSTLLNEYCRTTGQNRKHIIHKIGCKKYLKANKARRKRKQYYDNPVVAALVQCWKIFDRPCGQRLVPLLKTEVDRLRELGELKCSNEVAMKLKTIAFRTVDWKLKHQKEFERLKHKYCKHKNPLLYQKIPIKLSDDMSRDLLGNIQIDLVEHCGQSTFGEYICTLSTADINSGWWEGGAIMGRGQGRTFDSLKNIRKRYPYPWKEIHSDNGSEFINWHLFRYTKGENLGFSRSRPNKKNDNCFVEQKNWTHVKKFVGYLRYDTDEELKILNSLYNNELRFYKNFFQPVIKLISKERIGGRIHRKYDIPQTPYHRLIKSGEVPMRIKKELKMLYGLLNPARLKRIIDEKLELLFKVYKKKQGSEVKTNLDKKIKPVMVRKLNCLIGHISVR